MEHVESTIDPKDIFGFWIYILTDCILFATLFAAFIVLNSPFSHHIVGPTLRSYINIDYALIETFMLLTSNFTFGLAVLAFDKGDIRKALHRLTMTFILGLVFVCMELHEFWQLAHDGFGWWVSASASSFFALVGTHGLHVSFGLLWIAIFMIQLMMFKDNLVMRKRIIYLGLFWNFLDVIWIFVFSIVYLVGVA